VTFTKLQKFLMNVVLFFVLIKILPWDVRSDPVKKNIGPGFFRAKLLGSGSSALGISVAEPKPLGINAESVDFDYAPASNSVFLGVMLRET